jgi:hypothetical protein
VIGNERKVLLTENNGDVRVRLAHLRQASLRAWDGQRPLSRRFRNVASVVRTTPLDGMGRAN